MVPRVESRRRLLLLALIIVAVAAGVAGAVLLSLLSAPGAADVPALRALLREAVPVAAVAILLLTAIALLLFWRMTAPLLQSLESSEARYRTLFSSTAEGVLLIGEGIEECNDRFCELFRARREDIIGMPWRGFLRRYAGVSRGIELFEQHVRDALGGQGGAPFAWEFRLPDGTELYGELALRRLRVGERDLILVSLRDVTQRELATRELWQTEETLRQTRERLGRAGSSAAMVELAAGIAHEVNQPLAAIATYANACRRLVESGRCDKADIGRALDRIDEQARRAGDAIQRVRALLPSDPGTAGRACINRLAGEVLELMREELRAAGAEVVLALDPDVAPVVADPLQVQQVLVQLLRNAAEAVQGLPPGKRRVTLRTRLVDGRVEVAILDSGRGVSEDALPHLFHPFFSTKEKGMGMGLAMSMSIIRANHGEIGVDNGGDGACFWFRLPADTGTTARE